MAVIWTIFMHRIFLHSTYHLRFEVSECCPVLLSLHHLTAQRPHKFPCLLSISAVWECYHLAPFCWGLVLNLNLSIFISQTWCCVVICHQLCWGRSDAPNTSLHCSISESSKSSWMFTVKAGLPQVCSFTVWHFVHCAFLFISVCTAWAH